MESTQYMMELERLVSTRRKLLRAVEKMCFVGVLPQVAPEYEIDLMEYAASLAAHIEAIQELLSPEKLKSLGL